MTQEQKFTWLAVGLIAVAIIAIVGVFQPGNTGGDPTVGASGTRSPNGLSTDTTSPSAGEVRTTSLTVTGAASINGGGAATSTLVVGEIETYATSTATKVCLKFSTVATSSTPVANNGFVLWAYGACP